MKKLSYLFISILLLFSFSSCAKKDHDIKNEETTINTFNELTTQNDIPAETTLEVSTTLAEIKTVYVTEPATTQWTSSMIIDFYKKAATQTNTNAVLQQEISLIDISVNNGEGGINSVLKLVKPIISSVVSSSSSEINGITGGYSQLTEADIQESEAYTKNNKTIIKLIPYEQTDPKLINEHHGSVGHLICVVGDISSVLGQMSESGLPIEISNENISAVYVSPSVKVMINENGIIENGTWRYTVTLTLSDFKVSGTTVSNASVTMENVITLNGGFAE